MEAPIQQAPVESQTEIPSVPQTVEATPPPSTAAPQVEGAQSTSQDDERSKPDYQTAQQIKNLAKELRSLKQSFETRLSAQAPGAPQPPIIPQVTREELLADPLKAINQMIAAQTNQVKNELPQVIQQREYEWRMEQARQEGLRMIRTNELIKKDPEGRERMEAILLEEDDDGNSLERYSTANPKHAAQLALKEYQARYGSRATVPIPTKSQMASTATSQTSGAGRSTTEAEVGAIYAQLAAMPDLMKDPEFMAKLSAVVKKHDMESAISK